MHQNVKITVGLVIAIIAIATLSGCANHTLTPRYKQANGYQYLERKITDNYYMLEIVSKNKATLHTNSLTQASTLTEQLGFDWFIIVEHNNADNQPPNKYSIEIRMGKGVKP